MGCDPLVVGIAALAGTLLMGAVAWWHSVEAEHWRELSEDLRSDAREWRLKAIDAMRRDESDEVRDTLSRALREEVEKEIGSWSTFSKQKQS